MKKSQDGLLRMLTCCGLDIVDMANLLITTFAMYCQKKGTGGGQRNPFLSAKVTFEPDLARFLKETKNARKYVLAFKTFT